MKKIFCFCNLIFISLFIIEFNIGKKINPLYELASYHYPKNSVKEEYVTIAIMGTNDIHGAAYGSLKKYQDIEYEVGGYKSLSGILRILRNEFRENFLWFDAGDQFTGTYENILTIGDLMKQFYNLMKPNGFALGNHEWDRGEKWLREMMISEKEPFLLANLLPKSGTNPLPNSSPTKMFTFPSGIKIGVIGLTTKETYFTTSYPPLDFDISDYADKVRRYSKILRDDGAHAVILLCHIGAICTRETPDEFKQLKLRKESDRQGKCYGGELPSFLSQLNNNELDGVVAGHVHDTVHHWINGIPVIQNPMSGVFTNVLYLRFKKKDLSLDKSKTVMEGPIPICSKIYDHNKRCDLYQIQKGRQLIDYTFHSKRVDPLIRVKSIFKGPFDDEVSRARKTILAISTMLLERDEKDDDVLGNMICDILRDFMKTDVCFLNYGAIRSSWDMGSISFYDVLQMFPFPNYPAKISVSGKILKRICQTLQEGVKGYYSNSGLVIEVEEKNHVKRFLSVKTEKGEPIEENKIYTISSVDFLLKGGDDWSLVKKYFKPTDYEESPVLTNKVVQNWLKEKGVIPPKSVIESRRLIIHRED